MEIKTCINCQQEVQNNFCSHCAQRTEVKRITFREGWNDFWARVYGFDGMFPRTIHDLTIRPGKATRLFIEGNRAKYYGPVGYYFLMITLYLLVMSLLEISFHDYTKAMNKEMSLPTAKQNSGMETFMKVYTDWLNDNMKLFMFAMIPFFALQSKLFFRKSKLNFLEHCVMPFYVQGHLLWLSIFSLLIFKYTGSVAFVSFDVLFSILLFGVGAMQLFNYQNQFKAFVKGVFVYILGFLTFMLAFLIMLGVFMALNPEYIKMISPSQNR
jgi:Protein of unknown function (DUF3667)